MFPRFILILFLSFTFYFAYTTVENYSIRPDVVSSSTKTFIDFPHEIYINHSNSSQRTLLIYLPGSFYSTASATAYCSMAAEAGYHVISLSYPGNDVMYKACEHSTNPPCFENFHLETIEGKDFSPFIKVDSTEGILYRLSHLLKYLQQNKKNEGWDIFSNESGDLSFANLVWSGHSDGAAKALVLAKYYPVKRAVLFSGPKDFSLHYYLPPDWVHTGKWQTETSKIFAFSHLSDDYLFQQEIWDSIGLYRHGKAVNTTIVNYPYNLSHQLITSFNVFVGDRHTCTVLDDKSPKIGNDYIFMPVWKYLLDIPLTTTPLQSEGESMVNIFPNPIKKEQTLFIQASMDIGKWQIVNWQGLSLLEGTGNKVSSIQLPSGLYILKIQGRSKNYIHKFILH